LVCGHSLRGGGDLILSVLAAPVHGSEASAEVTRHDHDGSVAKDKAASYQKWIAYDASQ